MTVEVDASGQPLGEFGLELIPQPGEAGGLIGSEATCSEVGGRPEGSGESDVLGAGAQAALLPSAADEWFERDVLADIERGYALRGVHLVTHGCE
jgi:hypothetical protein